MKNILKDSLKLIAVSFVCNFCLFIPVFLCDVLGLGQSGDGSLIDKNRSVQATVLCLDENKGWVTPPLKLKSISRNLSYIAEY